MDDTRTFDKETTDILITGFPLSLPLHLLIAVVNHSLTSQGFLFFLSPSPASKSTYATINSIESILPFLLVMEVRLL